MTAKFIRMVKARPGLLVAAGLAVALFCLLPAEWRLTTRLLVGWSVFVAVYLVLIMRLIRGCRPHEIARRAPVYDEGETAILGLSVLATVASIVAIVLEMASVKGAGLLAAPHVALTVATVGLSWTFVHVMFALNYAHDYYAPQGGGGPGGLEIPGVSEPVYGDFLYFSFVIGCACATADIDITGREIRMVALVHGVIAFVFNTSILALTINIAAGLIGG